MTDQEGGSVTRLPATSGTPGGADFNGNGPWARRTARSTGALMRYLGLNVDLAPVADVNTVGDAGVIGDRSFSPDPAVTSRLVRAQICGSHAGGAAATAKHFPGHGSTRTDSHLSTPTLTESVSKWRNTDLPPFRSAVATHVDLIMIGHLAFPALDPSGLPATISPRLNRHLVRGLLDFGGVVITDSLSMGGITSEGSSGSVAVRSVRAGTDMLLMPPRPSEVVHALLSAVHAGKISRQRIDTSVTRILRLKQRLGLLRAARALPQCS